MRITKFSQIVVQLPYPAQYKGVLQKMHGALVQATITKHVLTRREGRNIISIINTISYRILNNEETYWKEENPFIIGGESIDEDIMQSFLGLLYVPFKNIDWSLDGIEIVAEGTVVSSVTIEPSLTATEPDVIDFTKNYFVDNPTPKEDLYIQPPAVPRFDYESVYATGVVDDCAYTIYKSLPEIPTKQQEISLTTNIDMMTRKDLLKLFPNRKIQTRASVLYEQYSGQEYHPVVGTIFPINGFTNDQILDNIVKYPHLFKLTRVVNDDLVPFYNWIEIDGELHRVSEIWNTLPESSIIPFNREFMKEYVVRRYLLERDVLGKEHKYPLFGDLDPFLTLFTTPDEYAQLGYMDAKALARKCVEARVKYKMSRNPVLRRIRNV